MVSMSHGRPPLDLRKLPQNAHKPLGRRPCASAGSSPQPRRRPALRRRGWQPCRPEPIRRPPPPAPPATPASTGTIDAADLTAAVDANGATSGLSSSADKVSFVGGLLSVAGVESNLGTKALHGSADGLRGLKVGRVAVLDLGAVLEGL